MILQNAADPLLEDSFGTTSIDKARELLNQAQANDKDPGFWTLALEKMEEAVKKLEGILKYPLFFI